MSGDWEPEQYQDEFRERLHQVIEKRMKAKGVVEREHEDADLHEDASTNVVDFMSLLQKSIEKQQRTPAKKRGGKDAARPRAEEHTSELQSLMRTSYADYCMKKK